MFFLCTRHLFVDDTIHIMYKMISSKRVCCKGNVALIVKVVPFGDGYDSMSMGACAKCTI